MVYVIKWYREKEVSYFLFFKFCWLKVVDKGEERKEKHKKLFIYCLNILYLYAKHPKKKIGQSSSNCGEEQTLLNLVAPGVLHYLCAKTKKRPEKESNRLVVCTNNFLDPSR